MRLTKKFLIYGNLCLVGIVILFVLLSQLFMAMDFKCAFASSLFMYCPGCGGTRAVYSLLHLDFLSALKYNIIVPLMLVLYIYFNISAIISLKKGDDTLFTKSRLIPIYIFVGAIIVNFIVRNILLWGFGIDLIGDFLG